MSIYFILFIYSILEHSTKEKGLWKKICQKELRNLYECVDNLTKFWGCPPYWNIVTAANLTKLR